MKYPVHALFLLFLFSFVNPTYSQYSYTAYDDIPGMVKNYKPTYDSSFPEWGKMLYRFPVNYFEVLKAFEQSDDHNNKALVRYFKMWRRHLADWTDQDGNIFVPPLDSVFQKMKTLQQNSSLQKEPENSRSNWSFVGPVQTFFLNTQGNPQAPDACSWQANVYSFDVALSNNNILYCGTETGFVNKTTDQGESWQLKGLNYPFGGGILAVAIHPQNPDKVFVSAGHQIHLTTDGGETWTPLLDAPFSADRLIFNTQHPDTLYAAGSSGLCVTFDGGESWETKWSANVYDVAVKTNEPQKIYALTKLGQNFRALISTDGGNNFEYQTFFPANIKNSSGGLLAVTPAAPDSLWAILLSADNTPYLYRQDLNTGIWSLIATGKTQAFPMNNGQGYFDLVLDISHLNPEVIFVGTTTFFRSVNGGETFASLGGYFGQYTIHPDFQDIKMLDNGDMWVSTDGGMYCSTNEFHSANQIFSKNNGLIGSDMWGFDQGWNEDLLVGGRYHNGNTAVADFYGTKALRMGGAESPTGWVIKGKSRRAAFKDLGNGWILPSSAEGKPEGRFLFSKYPNMDEYGGRRSNMLFHTNYYGTIYLGEGTGFWKSEDGGKTFDLLHDFNAKVRYLDLCYSQPDVFYADIVNKGLYRSNDGGKTWEAKPSLTGGAYGTHYWKGKTFFAISPTNPDVIYACLQNGTWSADIGKIFKSTDGGESWTDWTAGLQEYTKSLVIQPDANGNDIVYLFTNARNGKSAKVFVRKPEKENWELFSDHYPAGFYVNRALPFFRDSKLRVAGTGGIWESPLETPDFLPLVNPWVEKKKACYTDTLSFEDHSIISHENASWHWEITPEPAYINDANIRNPKVVLGNPGSYTVKMTIEKNGITYEKEIENMIEGVCPSINDCDNPAIVPKNIWQLLYVDSEELNFPGLGVMAFDNDFSTIWHTSWSNGADPYPHEIVVDMGQPYTVFKFTYYTRQDGPNGRIKDYQLYLSTDTLNWGEPVSTGSWTNTAAPQEIEFPEGMVAQYFKLIALSEINGNPWASAAEFEVTGCTDITKIKYCNKSFKTLKAFPVPSKGIITIPLPAQGQYEYFVMNTSGRTLSKGLTSANNSEASLNLENIPSGIYLILLKSESGVVYHVKVIKE